MEITDLYDHVWASLPLRKRVVGRKRVNNWVDLAVENWPAEEFAAAPEGYQQELVVQGVVASIRRMDEVMSEEEPKQYGFIWLLLLSGLVSLLVQVILRWWFQEEAHRTALEEWKTEMTA